MQIKPDTSTAPSSDPGRALAAARRFHWAGTAAGEPGAAAASSHPFLDAAELRSPYPLRVEPGEDGAASCRPLAELGDPPTTEGGDPAPVEDGEAPADGGRIVTGGESAALELFAAAAEIHLGTARAEFSRTLGKLAEGLRGLLEIDRRRQRQGGDQAAELGQLGSRFIDSGLLAETLHTETATPGLGEERQRRVRAALDGLAAWQEIAAEPALTVVHGTSRTPAEDGGRWRAVAGEDRCAVARELFDRSAARLAEVLRAVRVARLELAGDYDPPRHDPWLEELDWQAFDRRELRLLPRVVACLDGDELAAGWPELSRLVLSGRPVQVLVTIDPSSYPGAEAGGEALADYRLEPAFLGLGLREALVQQGVPARPDLLLRGFARAVAATRAGLHVIAPGGTENGLLRQAAAVAARAHPLFLYDPEGGTGWARRLDFSGNPRPDLDWPAYELKTPSGESSQASFTFADFAVLENAFRGHFLVLGDELPEAELTPVDAWLELPEDQAAVKLPYVWRTEPGGEPRKAVITRRLAFACRDRLDFWRTLQELGGARSEYADQAAERARSAAAADHARDLDQVRAEHAADLERVRTETAGQTVERLLTSLLGEVAPEIVATEG